MDHTSKQSKGLLHHSCAHTETPGRCEWEKEEVSITGNRSERDPVKETEGARDRRGWLGQSSVPETKRRKCFNKEGETR